MMTAPKYSSAMPTSIQRAALAGMLALAVAMGIGRFAFTPILPEMQHAQGLALAAAGWLASANYFGYLAGALLAGRVTGSPESALRTALVAVGVSTLAMAFTESLWAWLALRFAAGVASAFVLVFLSSWSLERFQAAASARAQSFAAATLFAGVGVGIALAGLACLQLWAIGASPGTAWITLGAVSLAASALLWRSFDDPGRARDPRPREPVAWSRTRVQLVLCYGAFGFGYIIPATFIAAMTRELGAAGSAWGGWTWPLFGAAAATSTFASAALRSHFTSRTIWAASHVVMAAGIVAPLAIHGLAGYMLSAILVGGTFMVATMTGIQEARRVAGAHARPLIAAMTSAFAIGQIAGPALRRRRADTRIALRCGARICGGVARRERARTFPAADGRGARMTKQDSLGPARLAAAGLALLVVLATLVAAIVIVASKPGPGFGLTDVLVAPIVFVFYLGPGLIVMGMAARSRTGRAVTLALVLAVLFALMLETLRITPWHFRHLRGSASDAESTLLFGTLLYLWPGAAVGGMLWLALNRKPSPDTEPR